MTGVIGGTSPDPCLGEGDLRNAVSDGWDLEFGERDQGDWLLDASWVNFVGGVLRVRISLARRSSS